MRRADLLPNEEKRFLTAADEGRPEGGDRRCRPTRQRRALWFGGYVVLISILFSVPLFSLVQHAAGTELHSHILLIPFISIWLLWLYREELPRKLRASPAGASLFLIGGLVALAVALSAAHGAFSLNDHIALMTSSYLCLLVAGGFFYLGTAWMTAAAFPVFFLCFMVPLPDGLVRVLENASTFASAEAANLLFMMTSTPVFREGPVFQLPGIVIEVARECSGIRSSWVLFITSILASYMFLVSPWRRAALVAVAIPLGVLRNGFRILVIGLLCVHEGPHMIHSQIHRQGGPVFFALSLIPLVAVLWFLRWREGRTVEERISGR